MFSPEEPYELRGDVNKVVFPFGYALEPDGDTYKSIGVADTSIAMATGSIQVMLVWLRKQS
jgi:predicted GH43/DUF377 family glycosyl hydrolase